MYNDAGVIGNNRGSVALNSNNRDFFSRIWIEINNFSNYATCNVKLLKMTRSVNSLLERLVKLF